jgi:hypothetical protein
LADFLVIYAGVRAIHEYIAEHEQLVDFRQAASELRLGVIQSRSPEALPDLETAERLVALVSALPGPDELDDETTRRAVGRIHGSVVRAVMHAVFVSYPDAVPHQRSEQS